VLQFGLLGVIPTLQSCWQTTSLYALFQVSNTLRCW